MDIFGALCAMAQDLPGDMAPSTSQTGSVKAPIDPFAGTRGDALPVLVRGASAWRAGDDLTSTPDLKTSAGQPPSLPLRSATSGAPSVRPPPTLDHASFAHRRRGG